MMSKPPKVLFHGNCQSMAFAEGLSPSRDFEIMATPMIWDINPRKIQEIRSFARDADLIISMPILENPKREGLGTKQLMEICSCPFVIHPNAHFEGYFPTFGICYDGSGSHIPIHSMGNPTSDYLCYLCYALFTLGLNATECSEALLKDCMIDLYPDYYRQSLQVLKSREQTYANEYDRPSKCVFVPISELLEDPRRTARSFDSMNHPSGPFLHILLQRILGRAHDEFGGILPWIGDLSKEIGDMSIISPVLPIYPSVARSLSHEEGERSGLSYTNKPDVLSQQEIVSKAYSFFDQLSEGDRIAIEMSPKFEFSLRVAKQLCDDRNSQ